MFILPLFLKINLPASINVFNIPTFKFIFTACVYACTCVHRANFKSQFSLSSVESRRQTQVWQVLYSLSYLIGKNSKNLIFFGGGTFFPLHADKAKSTNVAK